MKNIQLDKALKEIEKCEKWNEKKIISFIDKFGQDISVPKLKYLNHPIFKNRDRYLNRLYYQLNYEKITPSTRIRLLHPNSYFRDEFVLKKLDKDSLSELFSKPDYLKGFEHSCYLFESIIKNKDIEKLNILYKDGRCPIHITESMRNSHYDVKIFQKSLALAVEFNDLILIKKIKKSENWQMQEWLIFKRVKRKKDIINLIKEFYE